MDYLLEWVLLVAVSAAATISPGPAFLMTLKNATSYGRAVGCVTALGLALAEVTHIIFVLAGLSAIIAKSVMFYSLIKYCGAAYLIYIGIKSFKEGVVPAEIVRGDVFKPLSGIQAFQSGYWTNLLNPKSVVFYLAIFSQFINPETPLYIYTIYALTIFVIEFGWFAIVSVTLTNVKAKDIFLGFAKWINRICGGLLVAIGFHIAFSKH